MQDLLRSLPAEDFKEQQRFVALKESGALLPPAEVANRIYAYLQRPDFGKQVVADLREI